MTPLFYHRYAKMIEKKTGILLDEDEARLEVDRLLVEVSTKISRKNAFGYYLPEDMVQEGYIEAVLMLERDKYDFERPLTNFLFVHVQRRLTNLKRHSFFRNEAPCKCCNRFDPPPEPCIRWRRWHSNNVERQKVLSPSSLSDDSSFTSSEPPPEANLDFEELNQYILSHLPVELHHEFTLFKLGDLGRAKTKAMRSMLQDLLKDTDYGQNQD